MDVIARRVTWVHAVARRLAFPVAPPELPLAWSELVRNPIEDAESAWERAAVHLMFSPSQESAARDEHREGTPLTRVATAPQARSANRPSIAEPRDADTESSELVPDGFPAAPAVSPRPAEAGAAMLGEAFAASFLHHGERDVVARGVVKPDAASDGPDRSFANADARRDPSHPRALTRERRFSTVAGSTGQPGGRATSRLVDEFGNGFGAAGDVVPATAFAGAPIPAEPPPDNLLDSSVTRLSRNPATLSRLLRANRDALSGNPLSPQPAVDGLPSTMARPSTAQGQRATVETQPSTGERVMGR